MPFRRSSTERDERHAEVATDQPWNPGADPGTGGCVFRVVPATATTADGYPRGTDAGTRRTRPVPRG